jgi:outer membrane protein assembly factor BamB
MSVVAERRPVTRVWMPITVLLVAAAAVAVIWYWPSDWAHAYRSLSVMAVLLLTPLVLAVWLVFLSSLSRRLVLSVLSLAVAGVVGFALCVREVHFSGDMVPVFTFRWEKTHDEVLEEHRQRQAASGETATEAAPDTYRFLGYLGNDRTCVVTDTILRTDWNAEPPREVWRQPVGGGFAGFALLGNKVLTFEQRRADEAVVCYDADTGRELWSHKNPVRYFKDVQGGPGPRATPTIFDPDFGRGKPTRHHVAALGVEGTLVCLDLETGNLVWPEPVEVLGGHKDRNITWGMVGAPLVYDGLVVVTPGAQGGAAGRAIVAYDAKTGQQVWAAGDHRGSYSSPMLATLCGRRQILSFDGDGLTSYDAKDGKELWHHPWVAMPGQFINVAQPIVLEGDHVLISSGYDVGSALLQIRGADGKWSVEEYWKNTLMRSKFATPVFRDGYLYGLDEGILVCLDAKTGQRRWKGGRYGHGQLLLAGRNLLILSETGKLVLVEATPEDHRELAKVVVLGGRTWNPHALSAGRAFVRNEREMACYELPAEKTSGGR